MEDSEEYISFAPLLGECAWVWFCDDCGQCEGSEPQAGCCRYCGVATQSIKMLVRVEQFFGEDQT